MRLKVLFILLAVCFVQTLGSRLNNKPKSEKLRNIETIQLSEHLVHFKKSISTDNSVCPDPNYFCDATETCCRARALTSNGFGCCPYSNAVCCSNLSTCCPSGTTCVGSRCR